MAEVGSHGAPSAANLFAHYEQEDPKRPTASKAAVAQLERIVCSGNEEPCSVCLDEFEAGSEATRLPCGHTFHSACVGKWLEEHDNRCPMCRLEVASEEGSFPGAAAVEVTSRREPMADTAHNGLASLSVRELLHLCRARGLGDAARACLEKRELLALLQAHTVGARRH